MVKTKQADPPSWEEVSPESAGDFPLWPGDLEEEHMAAVASMEDTYIDDTFSSGGYVAGALPGYKPRPSQVWMAREIDIALQRKALLAVEGPTGTGKSLSYCVPASFRTMTKRKRVVVATANISLQDQLIHKDLPLLKKTLPWRFGFGLAKGRGNYLCRVALEKIRGRKYGQEDLKLEKILEWAKRTQTGDKSELDFDVQDVWFRFSTSSDDCRGGLCDFHKTCFTTKARDLLGGCHVIVANYHLLFLDAHIRHKTKNAAALLPPYSFLVMDEAHRAADIARQCLGFDVSPGSCRRATRDIPGDLNDLSGKIQRLAEVFFRDLAAEVGDDILSQPPETPYSELTGELRRASALFQEYSSRAEPERRQEYMRKGARCKRLASDITAAMHLETPNVAYFITRKMKWPILSARPVVVDDLLNEILYQDLDAVVATSATMTIHGRMSYIKEDLGLDDARELVVGSPFDWEKQALTIYQKDMPKYQRGQWPVYAQALANRIEKALHLTDGRALILFTSWQMLNRVHDELTNRKLPWRLLKQGEGSTQLLLEQFRQDTQSVLLGTESFWTGVDVQGQALSCVMMDKLPYPNPREPLMQAVKVLQGDDAFWARMNAKAVLAFKQGFGRLIRTTTDKGVVIAFDPRLVNGHNGRLFRESVPETRTSYDLEDIELILGV